MGKLKLSVYKSLSQIQGQAEICFHRETKDLGDGNGHKWLCELQQARKEQQPSALKGLCHAGEAGTEVLVVAVH